MLAAARSTQMLVGARSQACTSVRAYKHVRMLRHERMQFAMFVLSFREHVDFQHAASKPSINHPSSR